MALASTNNETFRVVRGPDAGLESIRHAFQSSTSRGDAISKYNENQEEEMLFETDDKFIATWDNDDINNDDKTANADGDMDNNVNRIQGKVLVTTDRLLFVALSSSSSSSSSFKEKPEKESKENCISCHDVSVDAKCIYLHALASDPLSLYIQITESNSNEDDAPKELSLIPCNESKDACQVLFEQLSELISRHPILEDDENGTEEEGGEGFFGGDSEMIFAPPASLMDDTNLHSVQDSGISPATGTEDDRQNMLDRLGDMLVVPPQLEIQDGQFDDADEEEDDGDDLL
mmetsp:Transcript_14617/g.22852  ORF Transcript_14617/g.22852 Transcript_14617/m.22852 type:complete len:289 (+) Transcript_14617:272-1138(+)